MDIRFAECAVTFADKVALHPLTLSLTERRIGVIGLNGSGKTTFARLINGLVKPSSGHVTVNGFDTVTDAKAALGQAGFIFQNPQNQLIMPIVEEDIAFGLKNRGLQSADIQAATRAILERLGITGLARRRMHELSGGETQLVAMASVLVTEPNILILDEPTNQLDLRNRRRVTDTVASLDQQVIAISHDLDLLRDFDRVLYVREGRIAGDGRPAETIAAYERDAGAC